MLWRRRKQREKDLERELRDHLENETKDQQEAQFAARRHFGNTTLMAEVVREMWGWVWLERVWRDLTYGVRGLTGSPVFTSVSVLSLRTGEEGSGVETG